MESLTLEQAYYVGELVGVVVVVVTLVFLTIQVRQNTQEMKTQGLTAAIRVFLGNYEQATGTGVNAEIFRKGLNDFEGLSLNEQAVFNSLMHPMFTGNNTAWSLYKVGQLPESEYSAMRDLFISMLITPGGSQWWALYKYAPPRYLVNYIDDAIRKTHGEVTPINEKLPWLGVEK